MTCVVRAPNPDSQGVNAFSAPDQRIFTLSLRERRLRRFSRSVSVARSSSGSIAARWVVAVPSAATNTQAGWSRHTEGAVNRLPSSSRRDWERQPVPVLEVLHARIGAGQATPRTVTFR